MYGSKGIVLPMAHRNQSRVTMIPRFVIVRSEMIESRRLNLKISVVKVPANTAVRI
jgi:hypothetical protein